MLLSSLGDVLEETYDPWDYFAEKRAALERFERYLAQFRGAAIAGFFTSAALAARLRYRPDPAHRSQAHHRSVEARSGTARQPHRDAGIPAGHP